jgi:acetyl esterase/lipase
MPTRRAVLAAAALVPAVAPPFRAARGAAAQEATPTVAQAAVETQRGVAYGEVDGTELLLDAYLPPAREAPRPAVILIHGGFWTSGSRSDMSVAARELAKAGYVAFSIDYRLLDAVTAQNPWPAQLDDAGPPAGTWRRCSGCGIPATTATQTWPRTPVASTA